MTGLTNDSQIRYVAEHTIDKLPPGQSFWSISGAGGRPYRINMVNLGVFLTKAFSADNTLIVNPLSSAEHVLDTIKFINLFKLGS